eukprot:Protomagalhaensia_sp_Gyna_25__199@NODE_1096_length_2195_cov_12_324675_g866_i0_p3_GENE_NODE_1096_length_2195_cov_12_324675_g866_i0NODE_1096_length_2195_cov_12_324675_g866_i0_p3_ORF_typecomplete_len108_score4_60Tnp_DNA_bind/PF14706_6/1_2e02Tnp_DNA_bind/PF14706_6/0_5_NODE_1096_length_2195_cov_12_324675_g866_i09951318
MMALKTRLSAKPMKNIPRMKITPLVTDRNGLGNSLDTMADATINVIIAAHRWPREQSRMHVFNNLDDLRRRRRLSRLASSFNSGSSSVGSDDSKSIPCDMEQRCSSL